MPRLSPALLGLALVGCAPAPRPGGAEPVPAATRTSEPSPASAALPEVPAVRGPLRLDVVYPAEGATLTTRASNFIFGSTGTGAATLRINGHPVEVAANGAFLGFVPVPADGAYLLEAAAGAQTATLTRRVQLPAGAARPAQAIDPASIWPRGAVTVRAGEPLAVRFRGAPGGAARLHLPDGSVLPMAEASGRERPDGFAQDAERAVDFTEYVVEFVPRTALRDPAGPLPTVAQPGPEAGQARIEVTRDGRVATADLPLSLGILPAETVRPGTVASARADGQVLAAPVPGGGAPYLWGFPAGTRVAVTGEREGMLRLRLTAQLSAWVDPRAIRMDAPAAMAPGAVGSVRVTPGPEWVEVRLATSQRMPFRVSAEGNALVLEVYGAQARTNWLYYGGEDPLVRRASFEQPADDLYRLRVELARPAWGWRASWDESGALVLHIRRPPRIDPQRPLAGIHVALDAGHPPGGATGPTRLTEAEANLAITRRLAAQLRAAGARVTETRPDTAGVELGLRFVLAERAGAQLLVSLHNNAFPDGVDPFANSGTTVFYNAAQSLGLARAMQRELLRELGLRDLGMAHSDLALVRPAWMPSVLTETMFLMVPRQEAALRDPAVQERIARAHLRALESFLREEAAR